MCVCVCVCVPANCLVFAPLQLGIATAMLSVSDCGCYLPGAIDMEIKRKVFVSLLCQLHGEKYKSHTMRRHSQRCFRGVAVITCASHAQGPRFDPGRKHLLFFLFLLLVLCVCKTSFFHPSCQPIKVIYNLDPFGEFL